MLTERENALRTILGTGEPEWVPVDAKCFDLIIPSVILERPKEEHGLDWFGCEWKFFPETFGYAQVDKDGPVLDDVTKWKEIVHFPDLDAIDWEAGAKADLKDCDRENRLVGIFWESGPFERSHHLLGFEEVFLTMYDEPEAYFELLNALTNFRIEAMSRVIDAYHPDFIFTHDDLGCEHGPLMSREMYTRFIKPCHMRMEQFIRSKGVIVVQHSCGMIEPFVGDMIECGAHVVNSVQGLINDQKAIAAQYGDKAAFLGGLATLVDFPTTTEEQLRAEVRRAIDDLAPTKRFIVHAFSLVPGYTEILIDEVEKYGFDYWNRHAG